MPPLPGDDIFNDRRAQYIILLTGCLVNLTSRPTGRKLSLPLRDNLKAVEMSASETDKPSRVLHRDTTAEVAS